MLRNILLGLSALGLVVSVFWDALIDENVLMSWLSPLLTKNQGGCPVAKTDDSLLSVLSQLPEVNNIRELQVLDDLCSPCIAHQGVAYKVPSSVTHLFVDKHVYSSEELLELVGIGKQGHHHHALKATRDLIDRKFERVGYY